MWKIAAQTTLSTIPVENFVENLFAAAQRARHFSFSSHLIKKEANEQALDLRMIFQCQA
jgi:hypothetical protein